MFKESSGKPYAFNYSILDEDTGITHSRYFFIIRNYRENIIIQLVSWKRLLHCNIFKRTLSIYPHYIGSWRNRFQETHATIYYFSVQCSSVNFSLFDSLCRKLICFFSLSVCMQGAHGTQNEWGKDLS